MRFAPESQSWRRSTTRSLAAAALSAIAFSASPSAQAHIKLLTPASWVVEGDRGDPQKAGPCGGTEGAAGLTPTGMITTYTAGETITVSWQETIGHPGHFRISLTEPGRGRETFVDPPVVTTNGDGVSGNSISAMTVPDGTGNVLKDNLFPRETVSTAQAAPFTTEITLPDEPCEKCTLQVMQFMAQHAPGYFYYHCADIEIVEKEKAVGAEGVGGSAAVGAAGSAALGAGGSANTGAGGSGAVAGSAGSSSAGDDDEEDDGGCALDAGTGSTPSGAAVVALCGLAAVLWRRRAAR